MPRKIRVATASEIKQRCHSTIMATPAARAAIEPNLGKDDISRVAG